MAVTDGVREVLTTQREQIADQLQTDQETLEALDAKATVLRDSITARTQTIVDIDALLAEA